MIDRMMKRIIDLVRGKYRHYVILSSVASVVLIIFLIIVKLGDEDQGTPETKARELEADTEFIESEELQEIEEDHVQMNIVDGVVTNPDSLLVVVNDNRRLPDGFVPYNLVVPNIRFSFSGVEERSYLRVDAAKALEDLFAMAEQDGVYLYAVSGFRSFERQDEIFNRNVELRGFEAASRLSAQAGHSEHQTGLAMDVSSRSVGLQLTEAFGDTVEGRWLAENAHRAGFIIRYLQGKEHITGFSYEPWHIRYIGEIAEDIYKQGITLEEYMGMTNSIANE